VAHYVGQVAAAGKAVYPLPLYANAALRDPLSNPKAGTYESGGPTDNVIPIWRMAAPALDLVAPTFTFPTARANSSSSISTTDRTIPHGAGDRLGRGVRPDAFSR